VDAEVQVDEIQSRNEEKICVGNSDEKFRPLITKHKSVFKDSTGMLRYCVTLIHTFHFCVIGKNIVAYYDQRFATIRHVKCSFYLREAMSSTRCSVCTTY